MWVSLYHENNVPIIEFWPSDQICYGFKMLQSRRYNLNKLIGYDELGDTNVDIENPLVIICKSFVGINLWNYDIMFVYMSFENLGMCTFICHLLWLIFK